MGASWRLRRVRGAVPINGPLTQLSGRTTMGVWVDLPSPATGGSWEGNISVTGSGWVPRKGWAPELPKPEEPP